MIEILKAKMKELEDRKDEIRNQEFEAYAFSKHQEIYIELKNIDYAYDMLRNMLIKELQKNN